MEKPEYNKNFLNLDGKIDHLNERGFFLGVEEELKKDISFLEQESFSDFLSYLILYRIEKGKYETVPFKVLREGYKYGAKVSKLIFPIVVNVLEALQFRIISSISEMFETLEDKHLWYLKPNLLKDLPDTQQNYREVSKKFNKLKNRKNDDSLEAKFERDRKILFQEDNKEPKLYPSIFDLSNPMGHYIFGKLLEIIKPEYLNDFAQKTLLCNPRQLRTLFYHLRSFRNQVVHKNTIILYKLNTKENKDFKIIEKYLNVKETWNDYSLMIALFVEFGSKLKLNLKPYIKNLVNDLKEEQESGKHDFKFLLSWLEEKTKVNENVA